MLQDTTYQNEVPYNTCCNQFGGNQLFVCHVMFHVCFSIHIAPKTISYWLPMVSPFNITYKCEHSFGWTPWVPSGSPPGHPQLRLPSCDSVFSLDVLMPRYIGLWRFQVVVGQNVLEKKLKHGLENQGILHEIYTAATELLWNVWRKLVVYHLNDRKLGFNFSMIEISSREMWTERKHGCYAAHMKMFSC